MNEEEKLDEIPEASEFLSLKLDEKRVPESSEALEVFDPLKKYLVEIRKFPLLSREEEMELGRRWRDQKDRMAAYRLVVSNLRLVVKIAFE